MQQTSCTEDRIQHALDRCLDGLRASPTAAQHWNVLMCSAGQSMNRWSLEELVKRDPENFLILLQQIIRRTREVQDQSQYELVAPLVVMFYSTLLQTPHCPAGGALLEDAVQTFRRFLTWPEPYSGLSRSLLTRVHLEVKAPGISFQRLVREEQGLDLSGEPSRTMTVLLMDPSQVPPDFLSVAERLCSSHPSPRETFITLIQHAFQASLGTRYPPDQVHAALQSQSLTELREIFSSINTWLESAANTASADEARGHVVAGLEALRLKLNISSTSEGTLQTLQVPTAKCHMIHWEDDSFDVLNTLVDPDVVNTLVDPDVVNTLVDPDVVNTLVDPDVVNTLVDPDVVNTLVDPDVVNTLVDPEEKVNQVGEEFSDQDQEDDVDCTGSENEEKKYLDLPWLCNHRVSTLSTASKDSMFSSLSSESYPSSLFSVTSGVDSDFFEDPDDSAGLAEKVSAKSLKTSARLSQRLQSIFSRPRNPRLSRAKSLGTAEAKDLLVGREKRSNSLPQKVHLEHIRPSGSLQHICFRRRPILSSDGDVQDSTLRVLVFGGDREAGRLARAYERLRRQESRQPRLSKNFKLHFFFVPVQSQELHGAGSPDRTTDIANLLGMLDPWYERNTLRLLNLPSAVVCQQTSRTEASVRPDEQRLPIFADLILYYCRFAARPALIQVYKAELTLASGDTRLEVFVHSLELGHSAGTRAVKAMGAGRKRFGLDGDSEALPLNLDVVYNKVVISGRSQWKRETKVYTSVNFTKACKNPEELDSKLECLHLSMTHVLKRHNSKVRKGFNQQLGVTEVKVNKVQVSGAEDTTFAVCLDQDEKKILQRVIRCDVSVCFKPDSSSHWIRRNDSAQIKPLNPTFCSLLCLPLATFSGPLP